MNIPIIVTVVLIALGLIVFLIFRNNKDRKSLEKKLNEDYHKTKDEEGDTEADIDTKKF